jgi:hypothetical protein
LRQKQNELCHNKEPSLPSLLLFGLQWIFIDEKWSISKLQSLGAVGALLTALAVVSISGSLSPPIYLPFPINVRFGWVNSQKSREGHYSLKANNLPEITMYLGRNMELSCHRSHRQYKGANRSRCQKIGAAGFHFLHS